MTNRIAWIAVIALVAASAITFSPSAVLAAEDAAAAKEIKLRLPESAGMSNAEFQKLAAATEVPKLTGDGNHSLTLVVLNLPTDAADDKKAAEFRFLATRVKPATLARHFGATRGDGFASAIQPGDIKKVTCDVDGDTAKGAVTFAADKLYEGTVQYVAKKIDGRWKVIEFALPAHDIQIHRRADNSWQRVAADDGGTNK
jgi:hypothetical protein